MLPDTALVSPHPARSICRPNRFTAPRLIALMLLSVVPAVPAFADSDSLFPGLSTLSEANIRDATIAFVNTTTSPGLSGAIIDIDSAERDSTQWRSSLGFTAEITLQQPVYNLFWGMAVVGGQLDDKVQLTADDGSPVSMQLSRNALGMRGSFGLSMPVDRYLKIRPYLSLAVTDLQSSSRLEGLAMIEGRVFQSRVTALSTTGSIEALYSRWYGQKQFALLARFNIIYTDTESEDAPALDVNTWDHTGFLEARLSGPTGLVSDGRVWRWQAYANHSSFLSQDKVALGYTGLFEIGGGLDWKVNIKPLDWFGWEYIGINVGVIGSQDVRGYNIGLTAR